MVAMERADAVGVVTLPGLSPQLASVGTERDRGLCALSPFGFLRDAGCVSHEIRDAMWHAVVHTIHTRV